MQLQAGREVDLFNRRTKASYDSHRRRAKRDRQVLDYDLAELRELVAEADRCAYCGCPLSAETFTVDHRFPTCRAADYSFRNLVISCQPCNEAKGLLDAGEFRGLLDLMRGWHPRARADVLARLRAGGRRRAGR